MKREHFSSRLGFVLTTAGCSIGLGNIWRFPYVVGSYGGAAFVLLYLLFLLVLGMPIVVMEFAVGRASQRSVAKSFDILQPKGTKWHWFKYAAIAGNYLLMMFYTTISGWMLYYFVQMTRGSFQGASQQQVDSIFFSMLASPGRMTLCMAAVVIFSFGVCSFGLRGGVERVTKWMMILLLGLLVLLAVRAATLPGAGPGLQYYLYPNFQAILDIGLQKVIFAAMGQAFFTLSIGVGALSIFGSRIGKQNSLTSNAVVVGALDTLVALIAGLIIFPACFAFGVQPDSGPNLIFITLPNIFNEMTGGRVWGSLFFLFMMFAAFSTVIAVFENIVTYATDLTGCSRKKSILVNLVLILALSMPCVLGFNLWSGFQPLGSGTNVLDFEDFLLSSNILPLGSLVFLLFCTHRYGWGWENFLGEVRIGKGLPFPAFAKNYYRFVLPLIILFIFINGYISLFIK